MPELKIGIQLAALRRPFRQALGAAAEMNVDAVEIDARQHLNIHEMTDTAIRQLKKWLEDANLRVCALAFQTRRGYHDQDRLQERIDATRKTMDLAWKLGARILVNQIGRIPEEEDEDWSTLIDVMSEIGRHAQRSGVFLAAETGSEPAESMAKLIAALPEGSLGVTLNPGNLIVNSFSASDAVASLGQHIMYVPRKGRRA